MNSRLISKYKIKSTQKTNPNVKDKADKINVPANCYRYMEETNAVFTGKTKNITDKTNGEQDIFIASLADMTQNDIILNETAKNVKKPSVDFVRYFMLLLAVGIFIYAGYNIVDKLYSYVAAAQEYSKLQDIFDNNNEDDLQTAQYLKKTKANNPIHDILVLQKHSGVVGVEVSDEIEDFGKYSKNITKLSDMNPDMFCWIKVNFTTISYPVVQTTDNDYYLYYSFNKTRSPSGAIFADYRNSRDIPSNRNLILYGHNMLDNSIFQPLIDFGRYSDYFHNGIIELITEDAVYYYKVFSANEEDPTSGYIQTDFASDEEYLEFLTSLEERSIYHKDIVFDADTKIITLSTCVNDVKRDARFVVRGILIDVNESKQ